MTRSCFHTHTTFCDGKDDVETFCRAAAEKGLAAIGFSAHAPFARKAGLPPDEWHLSEERLPEYIAAVRAAGARWAGRLRVYLGLEVEFIEGVCGPADADYRALPLDYIIGAVHFIRAPGAAADLRDGGFMSVDGPPDYFARELGRLFGGDGARLVHAYYETYRAMLRAGGWDIAAHLDLVKKNNAASPFFEPESPAYRAELLETAALAASAAAASGGFIEVNTGGMNRGYTAEPYPSPAALKRLGELGAPLIITADAHRACDLTGHYAEAEAALHAARATPQTFLPKPRPPAAPIEE